MAFNGLVLLRHDPLLTAMGAALSAVACLCAVELHARMRFHRSDVRIWWLLLSGGVLGLGAWGCDVLQLAGFSAGEPRGFDPYRVLAAMGLSVAGAAGALTLAWTQRGRWAAPAGGAAVAVALSVMRVSVLSSFHTPAVTTWRPELLLLALLVSAAFAVAALRALNGADRRAGLGAGLLCLSLWSLQVLSSAAATLAPGGARPLPAELTSPQVVAFVAAAIAGVAVAAGFCAARLDRLTSRTALQRSRRLADAAHEGILVVSEAGLILDANAAFAELAGVDVASLHRRPLADLLPLAAPLQAGGRVEGVLQSADGEAVPVEARASALHSRAEDDEAADVVVIRDLREQRAVEHRLRFLSEHDTLTGLPNRAALRRWVGALLPEQAMLFYVRVVNHAETNSLLGHAAGDAVLVKVGERLKRYVERPLQGYRCMGARLGGAEFAFAAVGPLNLEDPFPQGFLKALSRPVLVDGQVVEPQLRMGVSATPHDSTSEEELFRHAEVALEQATRDISVDGVTFFRQDLQDDLVTRRSLIRELKAGIDDGQLVLHYQPQARTADGRLCGFEALVRWRHPEHGLMAPDRFIPAAEQSGLIVSLGEHVLRRACAEAASWPAPAPVAVNLSPLQLGQDDLPRLVHEVLLQTGLPPARLELEITETALFRDLQRALDTLRRIKSLGVAVSMDDFGTGFSSLSTLQSFPFDKIKIDKSFVSAGGERAGVIVKAVLGIGRGLGIPVVAEGVETAAQLEFLRQEGCAAAQGWFIGKPAPWREHQALFDAASDVGPDAAPAEAPPGELPATRRTRAA